MVKLSLIIPCYNAEATIGELLERILAQKETDFEVIVINDGSTDNSLAICKRFNDKRLRIITVKNGGVSRARNIGLKKCTGKYVMFADADDMLSTEWHSRALSSMQVKYDIIIFSNHMGKKANNKRELIKKLFVQKDGVCYYRLVTSKIYKKAFLESRNITFNEELLNGEDLLFNINTFSCCRDFVEINNTIYLYSINQQSSTHKFDIRIFNNQKKLLEIISQNKLAKTYKEMYLAETVRMICRRLSYDTYRNSRKEYSKIYVFLPANASKITRIIRIFLNMKLSYILFLMGRIENKIKNKSKKIEI